MHEAVSNDVGHVPVYRKSLVDKYLERYFESHQQDSVTVYRGHAATAVTVYQGPARVHRLASPIQMGFGDEPQYMVSGTVSLPMLEPGTDRRVRVHVNDTVVIDDHWDPAMIGRTYRVMHIDMAGQFHNAVTLSVVGSEDSPTTERPTFGPLERA